MRFVLTMVLVAGLSMAAFGHGDDSHFENRQDVQVKTTKVSGNVYMLQGRGGNIGALVGPEGILIVDDDYKVVSEKLAAALKELGSDRPRFILNTHWHGDHTEGNFYFGKDSTIVAHINVRKRMMDPPIIFGQKTPAYPAFALPVLTYTESVSIHLNGETVRVVHFPNGHTDGDSVIFFDNAKVVHLGDDFFNGMYPFVDLASGGSVQGVINNVTELIRLIPPDVKLIPGHGGLATLDDLRSFRQVLIDTSDHIQKEMKAGRSLEDIKKAGLPEKFSSWGKGFIKTDMWIEIVYNSLAK